MHPPQAPSSPSAAPTRSLLGAPLAAHLLQSCHSQARSPAQMQGSMHPPAATQAAAPALPQLRATRQPVMHRGRSRLSATRRQRAGRLCRPCSAATRCAGPDAGGGLLHPVLQMLLVLDRGGQCRRSLCCVLERMWQPSHSPGCILSGQAPACDQPPVSSRSEQRLLLTPDRLERRWPHQS